MYNILISFAAGIAVSVLIRLLGFSFPAAIPPGVVALLAAFVVLTRRISQKVQVLVAASEKELSVQASNPRDQKQRIEKAVKILEEGLAYNKWFFAIGPQLHGRIGMYKYISKDLDGAQAHFAKASTRDYYALAMQGALFYQKKDYPKMEEIFESAVKSGRKEGIVWATYAWCLMQLKEKDKALKVMGRAVEANPSDEKLKSGLTALQNGKKLKMKPYEPLWWQFGLEQPPLQNMGGRRVQFDRR